MTLAAFVNTPGYHERYEYLEGSRTDRIGGNPPYTKPWYTGSYLVESCSRPSAKKGLVANGWKYPTVWSRGVRKTLSSLTCQWGDFDTTKANWSRFVAKSATLFPFEVPDPTSFQPERDNARARSQTQALNGLNPDSLQLGADAGELKQTINMLADTSRQLLSGFQAAKQGRWSAIPGILGMSVGDVLTGRFGANKWLEYQYGWRPLMGQIHDYHDRITNGFRDSNAIYMKASSTATASKVAYATRPAAPVGTVLKEEILLDYYAKTVLFYKISNERLAAVQSMGLLNPSSIAWELLPFTFVLDWMVPVGNVLSAMTATAGLEFICGYITEGQTVTRKGTMEVNPDGTGSGMYASGKFLQQAYDMLRVPLTGFPDPQLYVKYAPFSNTRTASAISLLRQLL